jgi:hypothetical protein
MNPFSNSLPVALAAAALLSLALAACDTSPSDPDSTSPLKWKVVGSYRLEGGKLIRTIDDKAGKTCNDFEVTEYQSPGFTDTAEPIVSRDSLYGKTDPHIGPAGFTYRLADVYTRVSGGPGIEGRWRSRGYHVLPVSGTPSDSERAYIRYVNEYSDMYFKLNVEEIDFTDGILRSALATDHSGMTLWEWSRNRAPFGEPAFPSWLSLYDIKLHRISADEMEYQSPKTGEIVNELYVDDVPRYSSTFPQIHPAYITNDTTVAGCAALRPWFSDFIQANLKSPILPK